MFFVFLRRERVCIYLQIRTEWYRRRCCSRYAPIPSKRIRYRSCSWRSRSSLTVRCTRFTVAPPFATFLWAVILSAWFAGTGPAIFSMLASTVLVDYYLFPPLHQLAVAPSDLLRMALFLATSSIITLLASRERRQSRKLRSILDGMSDAFLIMTATGVAPARTVARANSSGAIPWGASSGMQRPKPETPSFGIACIE